MTISLAPVIPPVIARLQRDAETAGANRSFGAPVQSRGIEIGGSA